MRVARAGARFATIAIAVLLAAGLALVLAAGQVRLVIVTGSSMEPLMSSGDLAVVTPVSGYRVGDVVAYRDPTIGLIVHRLLEHRGSAFVAAGDRNGWTDAYHPSAAEVVGRLALVVPGLGRLVRLIREPPVTAVLAAVAVLAIGLPGSRRAVGVTSASLLTGLLLALLVRAAFAAGNTVPATGAGAATLAITAETLKPQVCADMSLTSIVVGSGNVEGTTASELVLGGSGVDMLTGEPATTLAAAGRDCILAGAGADTVHGDSSVGALVGGNDVLVGGPGDDILNGGPGIDACHAGGGTDTFSACEVQGP